MGGLNNYQYVPNPVSWVDPLGLMCKERFELYKRYRDNGNSVQDAVRLSKSRPDFYVTQDGQILPSTFHRYASSKYAPMNQAKSGMLSPKRGGTYVSFDKIDDSIVASNKLQIPYRPDYRVSGDTLSIVDQLKIPHGQWEEANYLESITKDFKKFAPGGVSQIIIDGSFEVDPTTLFKML